MVASLGRAQAPGVWASVVVIHGLSCPTACGIFPNQGSNLCPLYWQILNHWTTREGPHFAYKEAKQKVKRFLNLGAYWNHLGGLVALVLGAPHAEFQHQPIWG